MKESHLLKAFNGQNTQVPVWFMRQAGRFLPEYREIRKKHTLDEMFLDPATVAQVTCLPVNLLKVDAAILFADILTLPMHLGFKITFDPQHGPVIKNPFHCAQDLEQLHAMDDVRHLRQAIPLINQNLPAHIPLIGFAGAPFTVLCYLVEGGSSSNFRKVFKLIHQDSALFHQLMTFLTENTIAYLNLQKEAGIKVFQLFDSWGGILSAQDYQACILPYVQKIFAAVDLPSIYYLKNSYHLLSQMQNCGSNFISVCETVDLTDTSLLTNIQQGIQGNLFQGLLYAPDDIIKKEVVRILNGTRRFNKYIFNLSHGIQPDVPVEKVKFIIDLVHSFQR
jgi:uroporphyrinogen decarboxylase